MTVNSIDTLVSEFEYIDVFAPNVYYKLFQGVDYFTYTLDDIIDLENLKTIDYTISNFLLTVDWNPLNTRLKIIMSQNETIIRIADFYLKEKSKFIINPEIPGSSLKVLIYVDMDDILRPMYIYKCYDLIEEAV